MTALNATAPASAGASRSVEQGYTAGRGAGRSKLWAASTIRQARAASSPGSQATLPAVHGRQSAISPRPLRAEDQEIRESGPQHVWGANPLLVIGNRCAGSAIRGAAGTMRPPQTNQRRHRSFRLPRMRGLKAATANRASWSENEHSSHRHEEQRCDGPHAAQTRTPGIGGISYVGVK